MRNCQLSLETSCKCGSHNLSSTLCVRHLATPSFIPCSSSLYRLYAIDQLLFSFKRKNTWLIRTQIHELQITQLLLSPETDNPGQALWVTRWQKTKNLFSRGLPSMWARLVHGPVVPWLQDDRSARNCICGKGKKGQMCVSFKNKAQAFLEQSPP